MKEFIFNLQRFDTYNLGDITVTVEGFSSEAEIKSSEYDLVSVTTSQDEGGSVTVINDYNFSIDGHQVKINNVAGGAVKFIYGDDGSTSLDLSDLEAQGGEMIYVVSAGDVDKLIPSTFANEIKIGSKVYSYFSAGNAYFTLANNKVTAFALVDENDSITVGKNQAVNVYDEENPYVNIVDVASGANYTVTKTNYNYTVALTESANLTIGNTNLNFEISKATKATLANNPIVITFENDGSIVSVDGLYNLTSTDDKLTVTGEDVTNEYGGLPVINSNGNLEYISVSDGDFIFTGGTQGNQTVEVSYGSIVYSLCDNVTLIVNKLISNAIDNTLISGTSADDIISNTGSKVTIKAGTGNDSIYNQYSNNVSVDAGTGNDYIENLGGSFVSIIGGKGNDTIKTDSGNVTVNGGAGNDVFSLGENASNNVIEYKSGGGNDTIEGFNEDDTLKIGGGTGTYTSQTSGDDIIIEVGEGAITLMGAASLSSVNIDGVYVSPLLIVGTKKADNIDNTREGATIQALGGNDTVNNKISNVSIDGGTGDDLISNNSFVHRYWDEEWGDDNYEIVIPNNATMDGGTGNDEISNLGASNVSMDGGEGNDSISNNIFFYKDWDSEKDIDEYISRIDIPNNTTINGGTGDDTISNEGASNVSMDGGEGNDSITNKSFVYEDQEQEWHEIIPDNTTILGGKGADYIYNEGYGGIINAGAGNDTIINSGSNVLFQYKLGDGNDLIQGFGEYDTLSISGGSYSTQESGHDILVKVGSGTITLKDAFVTTETININDEAITLEKDIKLTDDNDYIENSRNDVTIDGGKGNDTIDNFGSNVSITGGAGKDSIRSSGSNSSIIGGTGNDFIGNDGSNVTIEGGTDKDTISLGSYAANNLIKYKKGDGNDKIVGFDSDDTLQIGGDSDYSTTKSGNNIIVTVGEGKITLVGAASLETPNIVDEKPAWTLNDTTAQYGTADNTLVTVDGVKSLAGLSLKNKVVTVSKASLNKKDVTISDGYTLKLGSDVTKSSSSKAWSLSGTTAKYNQKTTTAGYTLTDNVINYNKKATATLATVKGVKSTSGLSVSGNVITVKKASLGTSKVTVSDGYTLKLGSDVTKSSSSKAWSLSGTTAKYNQKTTKAGYTLADNAITYNKKATATLATVKGVKSTSGLSVSGDVITVKKASLGTSKVTVSDGYTLKLGSDVTKPSSSKAWSLSGTTAKYNQTTKAGYTLANNGKSVSYSKATATALATVKGAKSVKGLSVSGKKITLKNSALKNKVTVSGAYEFDFASDYKQATITGSSNDDTITARGLKVSINGGNGNDTIKVFGSANTVTGGAGDDYLDGSANNDKLYGGKGDDILIGGAGNDSLWGDAGADNFIYSSGDGNDIIYGFEDKDTLTLDGLELTSGSYNKSKGALTLKVDGSSITLKDFTATTFNINDTAYKISGKKLVVSD